MKNYVGFLLAFFLIYACGGDVPEKKSDEKPAPAMEKPDNGKGVGEITNVTLNATLDDEMVKRGKGIYEMKCSACHKLTDQRVVGPGWAGVANKRRPEWIMNMITNVDVMLDEDPEARKLFEECLTRMPNQGVATEDARGIVEFMRNNDMETVGSKDGAVK